MSQFVFWFSFLDICIFSVFSKIRWHNSSIFNPSIRSLAGDRWNALIIGAHMWVFFLARCDRYIFYEPCEARNKISTGRPTHAILHDWEDHSVFTLKAERVDGCFSRLTLGVVNTLVTGHFFLVSNAFSWKINLQFDWMSLKVILIVEITRHSFCRK